MTADRQVSYNIPKKGGVMTTVKKYYRLVFAFVMFALLGINLNMYFDTHNKGLLSAILVSGVLGIISFFSWIGNISKVDQEKKDK